MSADEFKRASEEERAERAARDLKSELDRAKALVDEARRRLEAAACRATWRRRRV